jgi:hypothetical protein
MSWKAGLALSLRLGLVLFTAGCAEVVSTKTGSSALPAAQAPTIPYQQNNYGTGGTNISGPVTIINPTPDTGDLSDQQIAKLTGLLKRVAKPSVPMQLYGVPGNGWAIHLAGSLKSVLKSSGFDVNGVWEDAPIGGAGPGILIRQNTESGAVGVGIADALNALGLNARIVSMRDTLPNEQVEIFVSYKP